MENFRSESFDPWPFGGDGGKLTRLDAEQKKKKKLTKTIYNPSTKKHTQKQHTRWKIQIPKAHKKFTINKTKIIHKKQKLHTKRQTNKQTNQAVKQTKEFCIIRSNQIFGQSSIHACW